MGRGRAKTMESVLESYGLCFIVGTIDRPSWAGNERVPSLRLPTRAGVSGRTAVGEARERAEAVRDGHDAVRHALPGGEREGLHFVIYL